LQTHTNRGYGIQGTKRTNCAPRLFRDANAWSCMGEVRISSGFVTTCSVGNTLLIAITPAGDQSAVMVVGCASTGAVSNAYKSIQSRRRRKREKPEVSDTKGNSKKKQKNKKMMWGSDPVAAPKTNARPLCR